MLPVSFTSLAMPFKTAAQAVKIYFDRQYPSTGNCAQLENQVRNIEIDILKLNMLWVTTNTQGAAYITACKTLWKDQLRIKKMFLAGCTVAAPVVQPTVLQPTNAGILSTTNLPQTTTPVVTAPPATSTPATITNPGTTNTNVTPATIPGVPVVANPVILVSDLTNQNQAPGNVPGPKNPNAPDGSGTTPTTVNNGTNTPSGAKSMKDYFTTKNLLIGGAVIVALAVIGKVAFSKNKK